MINRVLSENPYFLFYDLGIVQPTRLIPPRQYSHALLGPEANDEGRLLCSRNRLGHHP